MPGFVAAVRPKTIVAPRNPLADLTGLGLYVDFTLNRVLVRDADTPSNNYDGPIAGSAVSLKGSPAYPGPNGGLVSSGSTKFARIATNSFPWNHEEGTIAVELVR